MDFDNPGSNEARSELSDFSGSETSHDTDNKKSKKEKGILGGSKKKDKEKKKEKEARYATLGDDSSGEEEGKKKSKKKGFQFGSAKKDKKEKKELKDVKEKKDKKEKDKNKLKLKKLKMDNDVDGKAKAEDTPVFGIPLEKAVERSRCHDGIKLPVVVRECIDFIEQHGLKVEGIYRSSGVKSKVNKLKLSYNVRKSVPLAGSEPAVVASLLKLFLRELPDPVLTHSLLAKFEEVCASKETGETVSNLKRLLDMLPDCNRTLVEWIFVHMGHVIQYEKQNKMSLQNVSIVLSPTMKISHRVLYCLFKHNIPLFGHVNIKKYVPPISGQLGVSVLPESPHAIEEEMKKQESLLEDLHKEISKGKASKDTEEKLWEQQRIVTQLKRKLRLAKSQQLKDDQARHDQEEELNFSLQKPMEASSAGAGAPAVTGATSVKQDAPVVTSSCISTVAHTKTTALSTNKMLSSPEDKDDSSGQEHRVTVQIHQSERGNNTNEGNKGCVTVIKLSQSEEINKSDLKQTSESIVSDLNTTKFNPTAASIGATTLEASQNIHTVSSQATVKLTTTAIPPLSQPPSKIRPVQQLLPNVQSTLSSSGHNTTTTTSVVHPVSSTTNIIPPSDEVDRANTFDKTTTSTEASKTVMTTKKVGDYENIDVKFKKIVEFKPSSPEEGNNTECRSDEKACKDEFPLLPPPPPSSKPSSRGLLKVSQPLEAKMKSKSLPRGLPSSDMTTAAAGPVSLSVSSTLATNPPANPSNITPVGQTGGQITVNQNGGAERKPQLEPTGSQAIDELLWEEMRLKFEFEELLNLKSELERKKKMERREIGELHEEIATMQTLYQYRTYSVDSSEDSDVEEEQHQLAEDNRTLLRQLMLDQADLQQKKVFLLDKLETERQVCLNLRVQIRMEQEKLKRRGLLH